MTPVTTTPYKYEALSPRQNKEYCCSPGTKFLCTAHSLRDSRSSVVSSWGEKGSHHRNSMMDNVSGFEISTMYLETSKWTTSIQQQTHNPADIFTASCAKFRKHKNNADIYGLVGEFNTFSSFNLPTALQNEIVSQK